jgi:hypothetical protein
MSSLRQGWALQPKFRWQLPVADRVQHINPMLAARLNRSDLQGYNPSPVADPYTSPGNTVGQIQAAMSGLDSGRISAGMVGTLTLGAVAFYMWTRKFQS